MTDENTSAAQELQKEFLVTIRESQDTVVDAIRIWAETVQSITPEAPSVTAPGIDKLPKPEEVTPNTYDFAAESQDTVVDAIRIWAETVQSITPEVPSVTAPGIDKLPKPEEVTPNTYDFAAELLKNQRRFAEEVIKAMGPLPGPGGIGGGPRPKPKPDPQAQA
jgi:hypothetical protein